MNPNFGPGSRCHSLPASKSLLSSIQTNGIMGKAMIKPHEPPMAASQPARRSAKDVVSRSRSFASCGMGWH